MAEKEETSKNQADDAPDPMFFVGDKVFGYTIMEKIDEGGFGQVFRVSKDNKTFAMKIEYNSMEGGSALKLEHRVLTEIQARHVPHFPKFQAAGKCPKYQYVVMQLLGENLKVLRYKGPNPEQVSVSTWTRIGIQCLYIIKLLHDTGFVHRDIKPANFAMGHADDDENSRLIYLFDFGLARPFIQAVEARTVDNNLQTVADSEKDREKEKEKAKNKTNSIHPQKKSQKSELQRGASKVRKELANKMRKQGMSIDTSPARKEGGSTRIEHDGKQYRYRPARPKTDFRGTQIYASPNAHLLKELGRADDVWSLLYMLADMINPLPWQTETDAIDIQKDFYKLPMLFKEGSFSRVEENLRNCDYYNAPDYDLLYQTLKGLMDKSKAKWRDPYDWEIADSPAYLKWKEHAQKSPYGWEDPKDFFKHDVWADVGKPFQPQKVKKSSKEQVRRSGRDVGSKKEKMQVTTIQCEKKCEKTTADKPKRKDGIFSAKKCRNDKKKEEYTGKNETDKRVKHKHKDKENG